MATASSTAFSPCPPSPCFPSLASPASIRSPRRPFLLLKPSRQIRRPSVCLTPDGPTTPCDRLSASGRLASLVSEFRALSEPIDRVKRLLHYAAILPEFEESARVDLNRVTGCTNQVWLDVGIDDCPSCRGGGLRMRFRADSDSEITKGFCSCLISVLDGAGPEEVLAVRSEDLGPMNMGVVAHSRVNTWHNVLVSMQRRTKGLLSIEGRNNGERKGLNRNGNGRHLEAQELISQQPWIEIPALEVCLKLQSSVGTNFSSEVGLGDICHDSCSSI